LDKSYKLPRYKVQLFVVHVYEKLHKIPVETHGNLHASQCFLYSQRPSALLFFLTCSSHIIFGPCSLLHSTFWFTRRLLIVASWSCKLGPYPHTPNGRTLVSPFSSGLLLLDSSNVAQISSLFCDAARISTISTTTIQMHFTTQSKGYASLKFPTQGRKSE
jgi:hypothetical protein